MRILEQHLEDTPVEVLSPHPRNPRDGDIGAIYESIDYNGFYGAVVAQRSTGHILVGNHRYLAALDAGATRLPVLWIDVDDDHAVRILLADNGTGDKASYHEAIRTGLLQDLLAETGTLQGTSYDQDDVDQLIADLDRATREPGSNSERDAEHLNTLVEKWGTREGQLWLIPSHTRPGGNHRLYIGDATNPKHVRAALGAGTPKIMITDPPYGVDYDPTWRDEAGLTGTTGSKMTGKVMNDDNASWRAAYELFPGAVAYVWHSSIHADIVLGDLRAAGYAPRASIIWVKQSLQISRGHYNWQHEPCICAARPDQPVPAPPECALCRIPDEATSDTDDRLLTHETAQYAVKEDHTATWIGPMSESTVWRFDNLNRARADKTSHGTQKPVDAFVRPLRNHAGNLYDPFAGSGTALIAAEELHRLATLMELAPTYAAMMLERFTERGLEPHLEKEPA